MQSLHLPILFCLSLVLLFTPRTHALTLRLPNQHTHNHLLNTRNSTTTNNPPNPAPAKGGKDFWRDLAGLADKYDFFDFWRGLVGGGKKKHGGGGSGGKSTTTVFVKATPVAQSPSASPSSPSFPTKSLTTTTARKGDGDASYAVGIPSVLPSVLPSQTTSSTPSSSSSTTSPSSVSNPNIPYEDDPNPPITVITISDDFPNEPTPTPEPSTSTSTSTNTTLLDTLTPGPTYPALTVSTTTEPVPTTTATTGIEDNAPDEPDPEPIFSILPWIPSGEDISDNVTTPLTTTAVGGGDEGYGYGYEGEEEDGGTNVVQVTSTATSTAVVWVTLSRPSSSPYSPYGVTTLPIPASLSTSTTTTSTPSPATTQTSPLDTQPSSPSPSLPIAIPIPIPFPYYTTDPSSNLTSSSSSSALSTLQNLCNASTTSHTSHNPLLLSLPLLPLIIPFPSSSQNTSHTKITNQPPFFFPGCTPLPIPLLNTTTTTTTTSSPYPQRRQNCTLLHHTLSTCHQTTKQDVKFLLTIPVPSILPLLLLSSPATSAGTNQTATTTAGLLARTLFSGLRLGDGGEDDDDGELDGFDVRVPRKWGAGTREGDVVEGFKRELRGVVEWDGRVREEVDGRNWAYGGRKRKGERKRGKKMVLVGWED